MLICAFDDRASGILGLKLLICGLARHLPEVPVRIFCPAADSEFRSWLASYPQVTLEESAQLRGMGYDAKPTLLLRLLAEGHREVLWLDSDIIVIDDFRHLLPASDVLVVAHEPALSAHGVQQRVSGWGFAPGRRLPGVNSCVVRVGPRHRQLLTRWQALLQVPAYRDAAVLPSEKRPPHLLGDQDVLQALLSGRDFADLEVRVLRSGREILQQTGAHSYTPLQRFGHLLSGMPPLIHCQGHKPWHYERVPSPRESFVEYCRCLYLETAPYAHYARELRAQIQPFPECLEIRTTPGRLCNALSLGSPAIGSLPQAVCVQSWRRLRGLISLAQRAVRKILCSSAFRRGVTPGSEA